jgi:hypothetical protein
MIVISFVDFAFPISPETEEKGCPLFLSATSQGQGRLNLKPKLEKFVTFFLLKKHGFAQSAVSAFAII